MAALLPSRDVDVTAETQIAGEPGGIQLHVGPQPVRQLLQ